ncbi:TetR/AcrR family transcriptional regulator [Saccharopolyspora taberi]|uniref:TetR/AcrR family transcriptional regulator n=2 Tax=Saccharopolyspora taberi TaxID=60895 RepID=A0ABN3VJ53_9PSEU
MLDTAMGLFQRQGYHATGLNQVLKESEAPRGSLYFHFPGGKQQLAAEAVEVAGRRMCELIEELLRRAEDPEQAAALLVDAFSAVLEGSDFQSGCPIATVALEATADSSEVRSACGGAYGSWLEVLESRFVDWGVPGDEAGDLAAVALSMVEGALLLARVQRDVSVLRAVGRRLAALLESARR